MAVRAVVFDVGETLMDETPMWEAAADAAGVSRFALMGILGGLAVRGEHHGRVWEVLGVERPDIRFERAMRFYPDALPCLQALRGTGYVVGAAGNTSEELEAELLPLVDLVGSSERWGVAKPSALFFAQLADETRVPPAEIAYVGDRMDNDVDPARAAGMIAVHIRRGPWGYLQSGRERAHVRIESLAELPGALERV